MSIATVAAALLLALVTDAAAQSLAEVARQEAERRKAIQGRSRLYTNDNLPDHPPSSTPAPPPQAAVPATPAAPAAPADQAPAGGGQAPAAQPAAPAAGAAPALQTEAEWRKRIATERDNLQRAQTFAEALQSRINALTTDFVNRDDPAQRDMIAAERQKALVELDRVKQDIQNYQKAIVTIQDEARRAGVPAGWVR